MLTHALGTIEVLGLPAAVEAADVACKAADVELIGYETTDGMGMVAVKIQGQVSAVQSAIQAAAYAASKVSKVFATSVIPRPSNQLESVVLTEATVGLELTPPAKVAVVEPKQPVVEPKPAAAQPAVPEPVVPEPVVPEPVVPEPVVPEPVVPEPVAAQPVVESSPEPKLPAEPDAASAPAPAAVTPAAPARTKTTSPRTTTATGRSRTRGGAKK